MLDKKLAVEIPLSYKDFKEQVLADYRLISLSRECSILGRREVMTEKQNSASLVMEKNCPS